MHSRISHVSDPHAQYWMGKQLATPHNDGAKPPTSCKFVYELYFMHAYEIICVLKQGNEFLHDELACFISYDEPLSPQED